jgi:hypothetical protein
LLLATDDSDRRAFLVSSPEEAVDFVPGRPRWWQWATILSLDAPIVAVLWQWMLAVTVGVDLGWQHGFLLAAIAWMVYAADRWIEGFLLAPAQVRTQRHWFYQRWRWQSFAVWLVVAVLGLFVALTRLTRSELLGGALLCLPVLTYLFSHQLAHRKLPWRAPKEICIAVFFSVGSAYFTCLHAADAWRQLSVPFALFASLCLANCSLIAAWEIEVDRLHGQTSLVLQFPRARIFVRLLPWGTAAVAIWFLQGESGALRTATTCAACSGVLLGLLDLKHRVLGRQLARALAYVALMTPLIPWLGSWGA